ncbi:MAG: hypothetical protein AAF928_03665 [Myxococcota bacterium]
MTLRGSQRTAVLVVVAVAAAACGGGGRARQGVTGDAAAEPVTATTPAVTSSPPRGEGDEALETVAITVAADTACALQGDGAVWCWGDIFTAVTAEPRRVAGLPPVRAVAVAPQHACAIAAADGGLWCWGRELAREDEMFEANALRAPGSPRGSAVPFRVPGVAPLRDLSVAGTHSRLTSGVCGIEAATGWLTCVAWHGPRRRYEALGPVDAVAWGHKHVCVLRNEVHECGQRSRYGGWPTSWHRRKGADRLMNVVMNASENCGIDDRGTLFCWSKNHCPRGRARARPRSGGGRRATAPAPASHRSLFARWRDATPCRPAAPGPLRDVDLDYGRMVMHLTSGEVVAVEAGRRRQQRVPGRYAEVRTGGRVGCGLRRDGATACWSYQGASATAGRQTWPLERRYRVPVSQLALNRFAVCGITVDGAREVRCWGGVSEMNLGATTPLRGHRLAGTRGVERVFVNRFGVCVDTGSGRPFRCTVDPSNSLSGWTSAPQVVMRGHGACRVDPDDGLLRCRPSRASGRVVSLRDGGGPLRDVVDLSAPVWPGGDHYAVSGGAVFAIDNDQATRLPGTTGATQVAAGPRFACARLAAGDVTCWGGGFWGELGDGRVRSRAQPGPRVVGLPPVRRIAAGEAHACAVTDAEELYCWGSNHGGVIGDGTRRHAWTARRVPDLEGVRDVVLGASITCALRENDAVCWGQGAAEVFEDDRYLAARAGRGPDVVFRGRPASKSIASGGERKPRATSFALVDAPIVPPAREPAPEIKPPAGGDG